jgi:hypothetical protein
MIKIKRILTGSLAIVAVLPTILASVLLFTPVHANAASNGYNPSFLISDSIFSNSSAMNWIDIQNFLNNQNSGLKNITDVENCSAIKTPYSYNFYPHCGSTESAAVIIYDAGQAYGINPQAIMATLQKEQSLISTPNPTPSQVNCAMGYNSCSGFTGFFNQVDNGAWQLRTYIELMNNRNWWGYTPASYPCKNASSLYSAGLYPGATVRFANPGGTAQTVTMGSSATAALYCYTPYVGPLSQTGYSGSYNFVISFETWFGSIGLPSCINGTNVSAGKSGSNVVAFKYNSTSTNYALLLPNNTGSECVEMHGLSAPDGHFFISHLATGMKPTDPTSGQILPFQVFPGAGDTLLYVNYGGTSNVNIHVFSPDLSTMPGYYDASTNLGSTNSSNGTFVAGDFLGRGSDQLAYVLYNGSSGHVEVHLCDPTFTRCVGYYDVATNLPAVSPTNGTFVAGDFLGRGYDQLAYVVYNGGSGDVEVHLFDKSLEHGSGFYDVPTNLPGSSVSASNSTFIAGNFLGTKQDQLALVLYNGTGSGDVEIHLFDPTLQRGSGYYDTATTATGFDPTQ